MLVFVGSFCVLVLWRCFVKMLWVSVVVVFLFGLFVLFFLGGLLGLIVLLVVGVIVV